MPYVPQAQCVLGPPGNLQPKAPSFNRTTSECNVTSYSIKLLSFSSAIFLTLVKSNLNRTAHLFCIFIFSVHLQTTPSSCVHITQGKSDEVMVWTNNSN